jgi:hypothetical protein
MMASLVPPSPSLGRELPAEPQGIVGGGSPLRPLTPSQFAERLYSTTPANPAASICHSGRATFPRANFPEPAPRWFEIPFNCVLCGNPSTDWIVAQLNSARECVCRSCAPNWCGTKRSTFSFVQAGQGDAVAPRPGSTFQGRRRYILNPRIFLKK